MVPLSFLEDGLVPFHIFCQFIWIFFFLLFSSFFSIHNLRGSPILVFANGAFIYLIYLDRGFYKFWRGFWQLFLA